MVNSSALNRDCDGFIISVHQTNPTYAQLASSTDMQNQLP